MKKCIILMLVFLLLCPLMLHAESVNTGTFRYMSAFEGEAEGVYYYSDDYFKDSGKNYNEHLLSMSYCLALSTFEIKGASFSSNLLNKTGFEDIEVYDMYEDTSLNTLGMLIGHKKVNGKDLLAVAVRGADYDCEWGNNFLLSSDGDAKGFSDASNKAISRIRDYIESYGLNQLKIWLVGYSRAGAICDLAGVYLNEHLSEFKTTADDLYIYTFETPAASADDSVYENIYIVRNINDVIPYVYPEKWGLHTNGRIIEIGEDNSVTTYTGLLNFEEHGEEKLTAFYADMFSWLPQRLSRETYCEYLETPLSSLLEMYFSKGTEEREMLLKFFTEDVKGALLDNDDNKNRLISKAWAVMGHNSDYLYHDISNDLISIMDSVRYSDNGSVFSDEEYETLKSCVYPLLRVLGPLLIDDEHYYKGIDYDEYYAKDAADYYISDEEMGGKYGKEMGFISGYDAGFNGYDPDPTPEIDESEYGPDYLKAYQEAFAVVYDEAYELGKTHKDDMRAKGIYDAQDHAYIDGYYAGKDGDEYNPVDEYIYIEDWMSDEYLEAYNEEYERLYALGYEDGKNAPEEEDEEPIDYLEMYHLATVINNAKSIIEMHYPQYNLELIQAMDSYYAPYGLIEGGDQRIDIGDDKKDELKVRTGGHLEKLVKIQVDDKDLDPDAYELVSGSTILTLKDSYLKTLDTGSHTLKLIYIDNVIETNFLIVKSEKKTHHVPIPLTGVEH